MSHDEKESKFEENIIMDKKAYFQGYLAGVEVFRRTPLFGEGTEFCLDTLLGLS